MKQSPETLLAETFAFRFAFAAMFVAGWIWMHYLLG